MIAKVLRKLGLGHMAFTALDPLWSRQYRDIEKQEPQAALELLHQVSPDMGSGAVTERRREEGSAAWDLDVIVPIYNGKDCIEACVRSILDQETSYSYRVLVVDDGSTDGTGEILDGIEGIQAIHQENKGHSGARNTGLGLARAEHIMFLDGDDRLAPGAIQALMDEALNSGASIVEGGYTEVDPQGKLIRDHSHRAGEIDISKDGLGYIWGKVYRRELFSRIEFPRGYWYQDSIVRQLLMPLAAAGERPIRGVEDRAVLYTQNPGGITKKSRSRSKSLDSLYITMSLYEDRQTLGLETDQGYYDYILSMAVQTYSRTARQEDKVKQAIFWVYAGFLDRNFSPWHTQDRRLRPLEKALRDRDYGSYLLYCMLH